MKPTHPPPPPPHFIDHILRVVCRGGETRKIYSRIRRWMLGIRRGRQRTMLSICRHLQNLKTKPPKAYYPRGTQRILILLPDAIGECLMATVFINTVKAHRPDIEITVASGSIAKATLAGCSSLDQFIAVDEMARRRKRMKLLADEIEQRGNRFCLVVEMRKKLNPRILVCLARIKSRHYLGYNKHNYKIFDLNIPHSPTLHIWERWFSAAQLVIGDQSLQKPDHPRRILSLPVDEKIELQVGTWFEKNTSSNPRVLLNFYAKVNNRSFGYIEAMKILRLWHTKFPSHSLLLLPVPGHEFDVEKMVAEMDNSAIMVAPYPLLLETSTALARRADLVFTPDTGMVHIASALNIPVVAVYRDDRENFEHCKPLSNSQGIIFTRPSASPHDRVYVHEFDKMELMTHVERLLPA